MTRFQAACQIIQRVKAENPGLQPDQLRKLANEAYPWGIRAHNPYVAWLKAMTAEFGPSEKKKAAMEKRQAQLLAELRERTGQTSLEDVD